MKPVVGMIPVCTAMEREREDHQLCRLLLPRVGTACFNVTSGVRGSNRKANRAILWIDPSRERHG
jgi:hypothetical protein